MRKNTNSLKTKTIKGLFWKFAEKVGGQLFSFIVSIVLARLLVPDEYGLIGMVTIFITLCNIFVDSGFGNSLVQKKDADALDFSSVFYFNIVMSIGLYILLFFTAPIIANFFNNAVLVPVLRVMGIRLIFAGINSVQQAYVSRSMQFRRFFFSTLGGTLVSAVIGICLAYAGYGVWALVAQYIIGSVVNTIILWFTVKWRPTLAFSFKRLKGLFSYGWKILGSMLINTGYTELRSLIIGKLYSPDDLAYYTKAKTFPNLIVDNVNSSIDSVLFPAIAKNQSDPEKVKKMTRRSIKTSAYIMIPLMVGLAVVAEPLVIALLTEKWIECVPYLRISCFVGALMPIQTANLQAIKAMGRSDILLKLEVIKKTFGVVLLLLVMRQGVMAIALNGLITSTFFSVVNAFPNARLMKYKYGEQIKDILPYIGMSLVMGAAVYALIFLQLPTVLTLVLQVIAGIIVYIALSKIFRVESYQYITQSVKETFSRG